MQASSTRLLLAVAVCAGALTGAARPEAQYGNYDRIRCESRDGREEYCRAAIDGDVRLVRQLSDQRCTQGRNWRWDSEGIRVRDGCRAEFEYTPRSSGSSGSSNGRVTCQSQKDRESFCPAPIAGGVRVFRNISDTRCREGVNYTWNRDGVRVWGGCRAEFEFRQRD